MSIRTSANISILYPDVAAADRPSAAARDGFTYVESWWPFDSATPTKESLDSFCRSLDEAGVQLVAINLDAGDIAAGERGLLSLPPRGERFSANLEATVEILDRTGCRIVNALYGNRDDSYAPEDQDAVAMSRLIEVADRIGELDAIVVLETLNLVDSPRFPLTDIGVTAALVRRANAVSRFRNLRLLFDTYHLATMGTDPVEAVWEFSTLIGHVQFADYPGRGRPGTGSVDFEAVEARLLAVGYDGFIGHEYDPTVLPHISREGIA